MTRITLTTRKLLLMLSLLLFPFLTIFGTYLLKISDNNLLLIVQLVIIAIIPIFVAFDIIQKDMYSLGIWVISLSLLLCNSLISNYLPDSDSPVEYYLSNLVVSNGFWNSTIPQGINAMLSVVMLAPILSIVCKVNLIWVFKLFYPLLYSLVPLCLYQLFKKQIGDEKIAFFSSFFFVSCYVFYTYMLGFAKQMTAEFFVVLLMLLITRKDINPSKYSLLSIVLLFSLVVSHYGLSYIFLFALVILAMISSLERFRGNKASNKAHSISSNLVILYLMFTLTWYMYIAGSSIFDTFTNIGAHTYESILEVLKQPFSMFTLGFVSRSYFGLSLRILNILYLLTIIFTAIGILIVMLTKTFEYINYEFLYLSVVLFASDVFVFIIPLLSRVAAPDRFYHISLLLLAPFCIIGGIETIRKIAIIIKNTVKKDFIIKIFSIFLMIFFLFNAGIISELITKDFPGPSILISKKRVEETGTVEEKFYFYNFYIPDYDFYSANWLSKYRDVKKRIFVDFNRDWTTTLPYGMLGTFRSTSIHSNTYLLDNLSKKEDAYIYLGYFNVVDKVVITCQLPLTFFYIDELKLEDKNKVYTNGGSEIYYA
jgi:uncharacterized membrane protein